MRRLPIIGVACSVLFLFGLMAGGLGCEDQNAPRCQLLITRIADSKVEANYHDYAYQSDVAVINEDGTASVFEDEVFVTIRNEPRSSLLTVTPNGPYGAVVLTHYEVHYDVPGEQIEPLVANLNLTIPSGDEAMAEIVIVSGMAKLELPLSALAFESLELLARTTITFYGYEITSEEPVSVTAWMQINFANWNDAS